MRLLLIAIAALGLSSCWVGRSLYAASDATAAIPPGIYRSTAPGEVARVYRVSILPSGMTQFDTGEKKEIYGFAPLDANRATFVAWMEIDDEPSAQSDEKDANQLYALMVRGADGSFTIYAPDCTGTQADIARKAGAGIEQGSSPACMFPTRASLERAFRLLPRDARKAMKLSRLP